MLSIPIGEGVHTHMFPFLFIQKFFLQLHEKIDGVHISFQLFSVFGIHFWETAVDAACRKGPLVWCGTLTPGGPLPSPGCVPDSQGLLSTDPTSLFPSLPGDDQG